jgi:hypothetical protein
LRRRRPWLLLPCARPSSPGPAGCAAPSSVEAPFLFLFFDGGRRMRVFGLSLANSVLLLANSAGGFSGHFSVDVSSQRPGSRKQHQNRRAWNASNLQPPTNCLVSPCSCLPARFTIRPRFAVR